MLNVLNLKGYSWINDWHLSEEHESIVSRWILIEGRSQPFLMQIKIKPRETGWSVLMPNSQLYSWREENFSTLKEAIDSVERAVENI